MNDFEWFVRYTPDWIYDSWDRGLGLGLVVVGVIAAAWAGGRLSDWFWNWRDRRAADRSAREWRERLTALSYLSQLEEGEAAHLPPVVRRATVTGLIRSGWAERVPTGRYRLTALGRDVASSKAIAL